MVHKNTDREITYVCAAMNLFGAPILSFAWEVGVAGVVCYPCNCLIFWKI